MDKHELLLEFEETVVSVASGDKNSMDKLNLLREEILWRLR